MSEEIKYIIEEAERQIESLRVLREQLIRQINQFLPKEGEDTYVGIHVPYCSGIKHLDDRGGISCFANYSGQLHPICIEHLPVESLASFVKQLVELRQ